MKKVISFLGALMMYPALAGWFYGVAWLARYNNTPMLIPRCHPDALLAIGCEIINGLGISALGAIAIAVIGTVLYIVLMPMMIAYRIFMQE